MIGVAVLVVGLLLILAGLRPAPIPGWAAVVRSGIDPSRRAVDLVVAFLGSPIHPATWYAVAAVAVGLIVGVIGGGLVFGAISSGLSTLLVGIGVLLLVVGIELARLVARVERWRAFLGEDARPMAHPYRPLRGSFLELLRAEFLDEGRWLDLLYVAVNLPLVVVEFAVVAAAWFGALALVSMATWYPVVDLALVVGSIAGVVLLPVAASISQLVVVGHRAVVSGLLCTSEARELRREVAALRRSRSAVIDVEAGELQRIERDLHDGAQQRLVRLTMDLGLAAERMDTDPVAARRLVLEGQDQARLALADLRDLVRGIAPAILLDRGLVAALESIAGRGPVPTFVTSDLPPGQRFSPAVERAAYFVVAEALANVAKHAGANRAEVRLRREVDRLVVEVRDDGRGGARIEPGGGLSGLEGRVSAVDGDLSIDSPVGGPTVVRAALPIASPGVPAARQASR